MISKGFYFSSKIEKNKGDRDFKNSNVRMIAFAFKVDTELCHGCRWFCVICSVFFWCRVVLLGVFH